MTGEQLPVPDPSVLTTDALDKAIGNLKDLTFERIARDRDSCAEKFQSVETQLALIERQRVEQKEDTTAAVAAALAAAKEAVKEQTTASERAIAKSETATTKSIDQLGEKFDTAVDGLRRENADLKERITAAVSTKSGGEAATSAKGDSQARTIAAISVVVAVVAVIVAAIPH